MKNHFTHFLIGLLIFFTSILTAQSNLVITEIMYNTPNSNDDEWVEICNIGDSDQDVSAWDIFYRNQSVLFTFPATTSITAGSCVVISVGSGGDEIYNSNTNCNFTPNYGVDANTQNTNNLTNSTGPYEIVLRDDSANPIDQVAYSNVDGANGNGSTLHVIDATADNSVTSNNWQEVADGGSPNLNTITPTCPTNNCALMLTINEANCTTVTNDIDNYTVTIDFTGGNTGDTYTITPNAGNVTAGSNHPDSDATGTITISDIPEDTDLDFSITSAAGCDILVQVTAPTCAPLPQIIITEIMSNPCGSDADGEFIEIYNKDAVEVDISDWRLIENTNTTYFTFPAATTIAAGEYIVVANTTLANSLTDVNVFDNGKTAAALANSGETIRLQNADATEIDIVSYSDTAPFPACANASFGFSFSLTDPAADNNDGTNFAPSLNSGGTPGTENNFGACFSDLSVVADGACNGDDATFTLSVTVTHGTGNYEVVNVADETFVGTITGAATMGTVNITGTIAGPTTAQNIQVTVRNAGANYATGCTNGEEQVRITIPNCPSSVADQFSFSTTPPSNGTMDNAFDLTICATDGTSHDQNYHNDISVNNNGSTATYTISPETTATPTMGCVTFTVTPTSSGMINLDFGNADFTNIQTDEITITEPICQDLYFTEIMYNPASNPDGSWEYIEVYNAGSLEINLTGAILDDAGTSTLSSANIAAGSIPAGTAAVLYNAETPLADLQAAWGNGINFIAVENWPTLNNGGDQIGLWCSFADYTGKDFTQALTTVIYENDTNNWPNDDGASSIELSCSDPTTACDPNDGNNWHLNSGGNASQPAGKAPPQIYKGTPGTFPNPSPLAVELLTFTATQKGEKIILDWQTSNENDHAYFQVERSTDGLVYQSIATLHDPATTAQINQYHFTDQNPTKGNNFYRLRSVDLSQKAAYSSVVIVNFTFNNVYQIFPNPVHDQLHIKPFTDQTATYQIVSLTGQIIQNGEFLTDTILDMQTVSAGVYYLVIRNEDGMLMRQLVKQ